MQDFFKSLIANDLSQPSIIFNVLVAFILSGVIGVERQYKQQIAGFRTHILIGTGAVVFMLVSRYMGKLYPTADPSRIASTVVSGIGFISVGAIIRLGFTVKGVTTVASIWSVAAIGLASGLGMYTLAVTATLLVFISLTLLEKINLRFIKRKDLHRIVIKGESRKNFARDIMAYLIKNMVDIKSMSVNESKTKLELLYVVQIDQDTNMKGFADGLYDITGVSKVEIE
jgi:putative Mg2+ transporter-C (MgtC) family protein